MLCVLCVCLCVLQVFNVPGRCYPVDIIHSQDDHMQDYVSAAIDTALQIHLHQPEGARAGQLTAHTVLYGASSCSTHVVSNRHSLADAGGCQLPTCTAQSAVLSRRIVAGGQLAVQGSFVLM